jgi:hypothetical protein
MARLNVARLISPNSDRSAAAPMRGWVRSILIMESLRIYLLFLMINILDIDDVSAVQNETKY